MFRREFKTRTIARDLETDKDRQKRLLTAVIIEIVACQTENDGLSHRMKLAQAKSVSLLHALEAQHDPTVEKKLRDQEVDLMKCEKRLKQLVIQADFLKTLKAKIEADFPFLKDGS